ncbi:MAG: NAD-dependent deacetylase [Sulfurimonas sp. RIFCSPHIGHO2_12_FULL_36_9]|uniref:SIR2 family NAD-dependent protein deacylase n=1 Tax=Sulfurimonas sp. RIFCSPLOWO2_12_36_12 TaxID=1802253 RepID=UPI0008B8C7DC|nr:Sir2 family NAD-dependent protein deacetylase [Sulfurimonas sp. RIFCSPLOWO2_12_36_12]OHD96224.1 MAG: NAD-dependent deacetylase [Sulfurimonas sp. RIFCSPHIGHO2_12_FULL_36_9]OHE00701.1 MAG: NAD-dependent deacetylase [Sulfurimonas sp. RIFCSPLOWO2_02_FULL_36_28]OHE02030.1 MAG: NAD-dependent deacetylase [Sulfurimonas sp. RIFCSPLOWO2_12_36_12]
MFKYEDIVENIEKAKEIVQEATAILITAGAGMGVDSGLPDFRGNEGFWKSYPPMKKLNISFSQMANPKWFKENPAFAWGFYGHRLNLYRKTVPHNGFKILLDLVQSKKDGYFIFTSNVDGQFQKALFDESKIVECHGSIHHNQCLARCPQDVWCNKDEIVEIDEDNFLAKEPLPKCPNCGSLARPNILMFGDFGWNFSRSDEQDMRFRKWLKEIRKNSAKLCIIEIGAGEAIATVRMMSEHIAKMYNGKLIRLNPNDYKVDYKHIGLPLGGLEGITKIC